MNRKDKNQPCMIPENQIQQFQSLMFKLFQCCQERLQYPCEQFDITDAELRCLTLFGKERYLTPKGIALKMNLVKSRISKIVSGLVKKKLVQRITDPEDSRVTLLSLTSKGQKKLHHVNVFLNRMHMEVLQQIEPEQRKTMITNLKMLKASMESVREFMVS